MARNRIKGKGLTFEFGTPAVKYECDLISAVLERVDQQSGGGQDGVITFCDAAASAGGQVWVLNIEAVQSTDVTAAATGTVGNPGYVPAQTDSLHTVVWNAAATTGGMDIPFVFAPYGNATPTPAQPHFTGTVHVEQGAFPSIGGSAGDNSFTWTYQFNLNPNVVTRKTS